MRIQIEKGRILDPANQIDKVGTLSIENGKIIALGKAVAHFKPDRVINAKNKLVIPGLVDLAARLREPGLEHKATIKSESIAAAQGGITSIGYPPDTNPIIDTPAVARLIQQRGHKSNKIKLYPLGALTKNLEGKQLAEMYALKEAGCIAVSNGYSPIDNSAMLRHCLEYAASCQLPIFLFAEDASLRGNGTAHEGVISTRLGLPAIPETAETVAISRALLLIEQTGVRTHFCRLSTARAVKMIRAAKRQGLPVSADVNICQLHLTDMDTADYNSMCHLRPPLRSKSDQRALIKGIRSGVITAVCSDHQPHDIDAKAAPFSLTEPGASSLEVLLPLMLRLVDQDQLDLHTAISAITSGPARIMGIPAGTLSLNAAADICILDPDKSWVFDRQKSKSAGKNTPFHDWALKGQACHTLLDGKIVFTAA